MEGLDRTALAERLRVLQDSPAARAPNAFNQATSQWDMSSRTANGLLQAAGRMYAPLGAALSTSSNTTSLSTKTMPSMATFDDAALLFSSSLVQYMEDDANGSCTHQLANAVCWVYCIASTSKLALEREAWEVVWNFMSVPGAAACVVCLHAWPVQMFKDSGAL